MEPKKTTRILTADLLIADLSVQKNDKLETLINKYGLKKDGKRSVNDLARQLMELSAKDEIPYERRGEFNKHIDDIYSEFAGAADNFKVSPGGSSFNVVSTLSKVLNTPGKPKNIDVTFFGVTGNAVYAKNIESAMNETGIKRIPDLSPDTKVDTSISFVIKYPPEYPGDTAGRTTLTFPGNAADVIKPHLITREMLAGDDKTPGIDALLVQGSIWQKLQQTKAVSWGHAHEGDLGFADKLLRLRWETGKKLWLTLPTTAEFNPQSNLQFQDLIRSANLILSNDEELSRVYTTPEERKRIETIIEESDLQVQKKGEHDKEPTEAEMIETGRDIMRDHHIDFKEVFTFPVGGKAFTQEEREHIEDMRYALIQRGITEKEFATYNFHQKSIVAEKAFDRLENTLAAKYLESKGAKDHGWKGEDSSQVAFITRGKRGAMVFSKDERGAIRMKDVMPIEARKIESTLGAGDTSFAGFIAGHIKELSPEESAQIGMALAAKKLEVNQAQLPDPKAALRDAVLEHKLNPDVANKVLPAGMNGYHHMLGRKTIHLRQSLDSPSRAR